MVTSPRGGPKRKCPVEAPKVKTRSEKKCGSIPCSAGTLAKKTHIHPNYPPSCLPHSLPAFLPSSLPPSVNERHSGTCTLSSPAPGGPEKNHPPKTTRKSSPFIVDHPFALFLFFGFCLLPWLPPACLAGATAYSHVGSLMTRVAPAGLPFHICLPAATLAGGQDPYKIQ